MPIDNPAGTDDYSPLSLSEAVASYANQSEAAEPEDTGQSDADEETQGDEADDTTAEAGEESGETDDEGQAEDEPDAPAEPAYVADDAKVLVDGKEYTVAELKNGTLRLQDYRQKTEAVAAERKAYEAKAQTATQLEQQIVEERTYLMGLLQQVVPQKPDASLATVDPVGYVEAKARYDAFKEHFDYINSQQDQTTQRQKAEQQEKAAEAQKREGAAILEKMPELRDTTRFQSFVAELSRHGQEYGYTPQELNNVGLDHRQVLVLRDAIAWRKLQASKSKVQAKVEGRPPVQRGGNRLSTDQRGTRDARVAMERLNSSGSVKDAVAALLALEKG